MNRKRLGKPERLRHTVQPRHTLLYAHPMHPVDVCNLQFYETVSSSFSQTRHFPWKGWYQLPLPQVPSLTVLDVGCGNARFYRFLAEKYLQVHYTGVDFSPRLLEFARETLQACPRPQDTRALLEHDLHALPDTLTHFDCIGVFGVLHHVAERHRRHQLIRSLATRLQPNGQLWITLWQFAHDPRFNGHQVPPPHDTTNTPPMEPGARWMSFDGKGHRYCIDVSSEEIIEAARDCELSVVDSFYADGKSNRLNLYLGFRRT